MNLNLIKVDGDIENISVFNLQHYSKDLKDGNKILGLYQGKAIRISYNEDLKMFSIEFVSIDSIFYTDTLLNVAKLLLLKE